MNCGCDCTAPPFAAPICTWSRATWHGEKCPSSPATRPSASSTNWGRTATEPWPSARAGIAWLRSTCGQCEILRRRPRKPLRGPASQFTGYHAWVAAGHAEYAVVREDFAYAIPAAFSDVEAALLSCAVHHPRSGAGAGQSAPRRDPGHVRLRLVGPRADPDRPASRLPGVCGHAAKSGTASLPGRWGRPGSGPTRRICRCVPISLFSSRLGGRVCRRRRRDPSLWWDNRPAAMGRTSWKSRALSKSLSTIKPFQPPPALPPTKTVHS